MNAETYYHYIENLSERHTLVQHSPSGEKHFFRGELEEFFMDLRNKVSFPAIIAESFEIRYDSEEETKTRETSFIVATTYKESKNWSKINEALSLCERIGDEFLRRMMDDAENGGVCANFVPVSAVPMLNEQHLYAGIRYTIDVHSPFDSEPNPDMWTDME